MQNKTDENKMDERNEKDEIKWTNKNKMVGQNRTDGFL